MYSAAVPDTELEDRKRMEEDSWISDVITREQGRLRAYIRNKSGSTGDIEDVLQDVFYEFVLAHRSLKQIEHVGAWLFSVARNRVTDLFRKTKVLSLDEAVGHTADGDPLLIESLLHSLRDAPDRIYATQVLLQDLERALDELPAEQREVFIAHELDGSSFKELAAETGVNLNTLLARKHYAVKRLRQSLKSYEDCVGRKG